MAGFVSQAAGLGHYERLRCLEAKVFHHVDDKCMLLSMTSADKVRDHMRAVLASGLHVDLFVVGNEDSVSSAALAARVRASLRQPSALVLPHLPGPRCVELPAAPSHAIVTTRAKNQDDQNSAVEAYWQFERLGARLGAYVSLLEQLCSEPLFDVLRTKQQVGYSVSCGARCTLQVLGFAIQVVTATHTPLQVEAAIVAFLGTFLESIEAMDEATFASNVDAVVATKLQADQSIVDEAARFFPEVENGLLCFDRAEQEAAAMRTIEQEDFVTWLRRTVAPGGPECRRLSIHVASAAAAARSKDAAPPADADMLLGAEAFKTGRGHYELLRKAAAVE